MYPQSANFRSNVQGSAWWKINYPDRTLVLATQGRTFAIQTQEFLRRWAEHDSITFATPDTSRRFSFGDIVADGTICESTIAALYWYVCRQAGGCASATDAPSNTVAGIPVEEQSFLAQLRGEWRDQRIGQATTRAMAWVMSRQITWDIQTSQAAPTSSVPRFRVTGQVAAFREPTWQMIGVPEDATMLPWCEAVIADAPHFNEIVMFDTRSPISLPPDTSPVLPPVRDVGRNVSGILGGAVGSVFKLSAVAVVAGAAAFFVVSRSSGRSRRR